MSPFQSPATLVFLCKDDLGKFLMLRLKIISCDKLYYSILIVDTYVSDALSKVRKNIDEVDLQLMELLLKRFALAKKAAGEKPSEDSVYDPLREKQIVNSAIEYFKKNDLGIETTFVKTVFENILAESRKQVEQEFIRLKGAKQ